ncbi:uncharacterized protein VNE69_03248 [Vairimorpha necatrix]|uniref:Uncharacterized protein n=1 Tax=Vairimorpha necatrix TaxID=6039 RepID=A0AAX4JAQ3_9MICR
MGFTKRKKKEEETCEIEAGLSTSGVQESVNSLLPQGCYSHRPRIDKILVTNRDYGVHQTQKKEEETCEIGADLLTSGVQESVNSLVLEGYKPECEVSSFRKAAIYTDQEMIKFWSQTETLFNRIKIEEGRNANQRYCGRAGLMASLVSYCKSSHGVTSIHQDIKT